MVTETYDGVANQGITGLFTGLGWGLVGTISKPAIGMLDLATGAATAVRESSRSSSRQGRNSLDDMLFLIFYLTKMKLRSTIRVFY